MELANIMLALGNDRGNTIPKYDVTPAEIVVLLRIHGEDAVFDIEPTGETAVERGSREERARLLEAYRAVDGSEPVVMQVYPGQMPVLHTQIADLGLPETFFKATARVQPAKAAVKIKPPKKPAPAVEVDLFDAAPADVME